MITRASLDDSIHMLAEQIREWSIEQKVFWQKIPSLALDADGRDGYSRHLKFCYTHGLWAIDERANRNYAFFEAVDCATGEIIIMRGQLGELLDASDNAVAGLVANLDQIDAAKIIARLTAQIKQPRPSHITQAQWETAQNNRDEIRRLNGLSNTRPFRRTRNLTAVH